MTGRTAVAGLLIVFAMMLFSGAAAIAAEAYRVLALLVLGGLIALGLALYNRRKVRELHDHEATIGGWIRHPFHTQPGDQRACPGCGADCTGWRNWTRHQAACGPYRAWEAARLRQVDEDTRVPWTAVVEDKSDDEEAIDA